MGWVGRGGTVLQSAAHCVLLETHSVCWSTKGSEKSCSKEASFHFIQLLTEVLDFGTLFFTQDLLSFHRAEFGTWGSKWNLSVMTGRWLSHPGDDWADSTYKQASLSYRSQWQGSASDLLAGLTQPWLFIEWSEQVSRMQWVKHWAWSQTVRASPRPGTY